MADAREFTEADVKAWRDGNWIFVTLAGEPVLKRLTRDPKFTHAVAVFSETRSPRYPRTRQHFVRAELTGAWERPKHRGPSGANRLTVPIIDHTPQGTKWPTAHDGGQPGDSHPPAARHHTKGYQ